jgi:FKBP-type peptidyl-prolyl cis-trans isomerase
MRRPVLAIAACGLIVASLGVAGCSKEETTTARSVAASRPAALDAAAREGGKWNADAIHAQQVDMEKKKVAPTTNAAATTLPDLGPNAVTLPDGLSYVDLKVGTGPAVKLGDKITVNYTGGFPDGTVFDSTSKTGVPITFTLAKGQLIEGWIEGIPGMKVGGRRTITIPPALGYGAAGMPPTIPPNANLVFTVELVAIK